MFRIPPALNLKDPSTLLALWFGCGLMRPGPGTWGTMGALPFGIIFLVLGGPVILVLASAALFYPGLKAAGRVIDATGEHDPKIVVVDEVSGPPGRHLVEQFWHAGAGAVRTERGTVQIGQEVEMSPAGDAEIRRGGDFGWRSPTYGTRHEATVISLQWQTQLPWRAETVFRLALQPEKGGSI